MLISWHGKKKADEEYETVNHTRQSTKRDADREQVLKDIGGEYYEGLTYETTYRMPRKDGSWFWTVDKGKVIRTEEGKLAIISACYDMTSFLERYKKIETVEASDMGENLRGKHVLLAEDNDLNAE